jgi:hypothetical protein
MPEIQNDGCHTGSSYISRSTTDRYAVQTAKPGFFWVAQHDGAIADIRHCRPTPETQDSNRRTGSNIKLRSITDRHAAPKVDPDFGGNPTRRNLRLLIPETQNGTAKPEVVISRLS